MQTSSKAMYALAVEIQTVIGKEKLAFIGKQRASTVNSDIASSKDYFIKSQKQNKYFDDGFSDCHDNKKQDYHRQARLNGNKKQAEQK
jgi:lysozyme family protein